MYQILKGVLFLLDYFFPILKGKQRLILGKATFMKNSSIRLWNIRKPIRPHNLSIVLLTYFMQMTVFVFMTQLERTVVSC